VGIDDATPAEQVSRERMERPETIELIRLYYAIPDEMCAGSFLQVLKAVAARSEAKPKPAPNAQPKKRVLAPRRKRLS
jgi:hypothetical protein